MVAMNRRQVKDEVDSKIGKNIRQVRKSRYLSRDELAAALGITNSHFGLIERGERGVTAVNLIKLLEFLDIPFDRLIADPDKPEKTMKAKQNARQQRRDKIISFATCLTDEELDPVIDAIKAFVEIKKS